MRSVLSFSMSADLVTFIQKTAKAMKISASEYAQRVFESQRALISEEELLEDIRIGEEEYRTGKCKVLRTKKDIEKFFRH